MSRQRRIIILGSTGSIGCNTLEVVEHLSRVTETTWDVVGLGAHANDSLLAQQAAAFGPGHVAVSHPEAAARWSGTAVLHGGPSSHVELVQAVARPGDMVVAAVVGAAGIDAVLAAIDAGCDIALANKETLVAAGSLVMPAARAKGVSILPVDSEHSAIFQCLAGVDDMRQIERIVLTASGGPFRGRRREEIADATVEEALAHPTWTMGRKITIDSATLANKALEIIEAHWLFGLPASKIDAIVHRQSIVHGFVEFVDGSVLAQAGPPDMKTPIQVALTWPERLDGVGTRLDWTTLRSLDFEQVDHDTFGFIREAWRVVDAGGTAGATFNAANESAVESFLDGRIRFGEVLDLLRQTCSEIDVRQVTGPEDVRDADRAARAHVGGLIGSMTTL